MIWLGLGLGCTAGPVKEPLGEMVQVAAGSVYLGPRQLPPVDGWEAPKEQGGITPNGGKGGAQRAAGGPPIPGAGVGHVRPGSGTPSAPPNMPGSRHKRAGGEERMWTANPGSQMKPKLVEVPSFWIDRTEVTRKSYKEFLEATGYRPPYVDEEWAEDGWNWTGTEYPEGTGDHPVVMLSWYDAAEFCLWRGKSLPTEAQWQLAALGDHGEGRTFPWGSKYDHGVLNHGKILAPNFDDSDGYLTTSPVGSFPKGDSPSGASDMFGNAWEFTADYRRSSWNFYEDSSSGKTSPGPGLYVAVRGGSYFFDLRPHPGGERNEFLTEVRRKTSGFRCAR